MPSRYKARDLRPKTFVEPPFLSGKEVPKVVILIPGIRTNAEWIDELTRWVETHLDTIKVYGSYGGRISSYQLITRIGLRPIKDEVRRQIIRVKIENPGVEVSLICHSMGTDILAAILDDLPFTFEYIFCIGAICHIRHSQRLANSCRFLINHRGNQDSWPIMASIVRPFHYSATGTFGFRKGFIEDVIFDTNHETCTSVDHVTKFIMPVIFGENIVLPPGTNRPIFDFNLYYYVRRGFYVFIILGLLGCYFTFYSLMLPILFAVFALWFYCRPRK